MPTITQHGGASYAGHERNEVSGEWIQANLEENSAAELVESDERLAAEAPPRRRTRRRKQ